MGSLDAGLAGLFDYLLKDRETIKAQERDDKQWESRERLRARIGLDIDKEKAGLQEKRGDAYQTEDGTWLVPLYDGYGRQKGSAPATKAEEAKGSQAITDATNSSNRATVSGEEARVAGKLADLGVTKAEADIAATNQRVSSDRAQEGRQAEAHRLAMEKAKKEIAEEATRDIESAAEGLSASYSRTEAANQIALMNDEIAAAKTPEQLRIVVRKWLGSSKRAKVLLDNALYNMREKPADSSSVLSGFTPAQPLDPNGRPQR